MSGVGTLEPERKVFEDDRVIVWHHDLAPGEHGERHTHERDFVVRILAANEALVYLAQGADTGELACDAIRRWWHRMGKWRYDEEHPILLLADCGGSNGYRVPLFRQQLHQLSGGIPPGSRRSQRRIVVHRRTRSW